VSESRGLARNARQCWAFLRFSTAQRIFDAGRLVEEGTHAELAAGEGTYAVLYGSWLGNVREDGAA